MRQPSRRPTASLRVNCTRIGIRIIHPPRSASRKCSRPMKPCPIRAPVRNTTGCANSAAVPSAAGHMRVHPLAEARLSKPARGSVIVRIPMARSCAWMPTTIPQGDLPTFSSASSEVQARERLVLAPGPVAPAARRGRLIRRPMIATVPCASASIACSRAENSLFRWTVTRFRYPSRKASRTATKCASVERVAPCRMGAMATCM